MVIGACSLELHLPACRSLKDKRSVIKRLVHRLTARFNVAVAEVEYQDLWQRAGIAVVSVSNSRTRLEGMFEKLIDEVERGAESLLTRVETEYL